MIAKLSTGKWKWMIMVMMIAYYTGREKYIRDMETFEVTEMISTITVVRTLPKSLTILQMVLYT